MLPLNLDGSEDCCRASDIFPDLHLVYLALGKQLLTNPRNQIQWVGREVKCKIKNPKDMIRSENKSRIIKNSERLNWLGFVKGVKSE